MEFIHGLKISDIEGIKNLGLNLKEVGFLFKIIFRRKSSTYLTNQNLRLIKTWSYYLLSRYFILVLYMPIHIMEIYISEQKPTQKMVIILVFIIVMNQTKSSQIHHYFIILFLKNGIKI